MDKEKPEVTQEDKEPEPFDAQKFAAELTESVKTELKPLLKPVEAPNIIIPESDKNVNPYKWTTKRLDWQGEPVIKQPEWYEKRKAANDWIRAVHKGDRGTILELHKKGLIEGTDSLGGFLVPEEFRAEIVYFFEKYGIARRFCRVFPMSGDVLRVPTASSSVDVTWTGEAAAKTASTPAFGQVELQAKEASAYTVFSDALLADVSVDLVGWCSEQYANGFAYAEDYQLFRGTGNPFSGILVNSGVNTVDMTGDLFSDILLDELLEMIDAIATQYEDGSRWFMHKKAMLYLRKIKESTGGAYVLDRPAQSGQPTTLWGYPVERTSVLPSTTAVSTEWVVFGNLKHAFFGDRQTMTAKMIDQGTLNSVSMAETNQTALRVTERVAIVLGVPAAFATLKTAAS